MAEMINNEVVVDEVENKIVETRTVEEQKGFFQRLGKKKLLIGGAAAVGVIGALIGASRNKKRHEAEIEEMLSYSRPEGDNDENQTKSDETVG